MIEVIVGNVGPVYRGDDHEKAIDEFKAYVKLSKDERQCGRCFEEPVTMIVNGAVFMEYEPIPGTGGLRYDGTQDEGWDADDGGPGQDYNSAFQDLLDPWGI